MLQRLPRLDCCAVFLIDYRFCSGQAVSLPGLDQGKVPAKAQAAAEAKVVAPVPAVPMSGMAASKLLPTVPQALRPPAVSFTTTAEQHVSVAAVKQEPVADALSQVAELQPVAVKQEPAADALSQVAEQPKQEPAADAGPDALSQIVAMAKPAEADAAGLSQVEPPLTPQNQTVSDIGHPLLLEQAICQPNTASSFSSA